MAPEGEEFPDLYTLHHRHYGLTEPLGASYAEAAAVCLSRHHEPPVPLQVFADGGDHSVYQVVWNPPSERQGAAWANRDDATRDGAYCVILAAAEAHLGLVAIRRAETKTGADYYVAPPDPSGSGGDPELNLEEAFRLEVSGIDHCESEIQLRARVRQKVEQAQHGNSNLPAIAGVVAFSLLMIVFRNA